MFIHLDRVPACDRRTDRRTDGIAVGITALCIASNAAGFKNYTQCTKTLHWAYAVFTKNAKMVIVCFICSLTIICCVQSVCVHVALCCLIVLMYSSLFTISSSNSHDIMIIEIIKNNYISKQYTHTGLHI